MTATAAPTGLDLLMAIRDGDHPPAPIQAPRTAAAIIENSVTTSTGITEM